jgi:hypothetical protein
LHRQPSRDGRRRGSRTSAAWNDVVKRVRALPTPPRRAALLVVPSPVTYVSGTRDSGGGDLPATEPSWRLRSPCGQESLGESRTPRIADGRDKAACALLPDDARPGKPQTESMPQMQHDFPNRVGCIEGMVSCPRSLEQVKLYKVGHVIKVSVAGQPDALEILWQSLWLRETGSWR